MTKTHRPRLIKHAAARAFAFALLLATSGSLGGCGSSSTKAAEGTDTNISNATTTAVATAAEKVPRIDLTVTIPGMAGKNALPKRYTCDGRNISPPIHWGKAPAGTKEIDIIIATLENTGTEYVQWAVAGIKPSLQGLQPGQTPPGAIIGRNRYGQTSYSICPRHRHRVSYTVLYFPLPQHVPAKPGFNPLRLGQQLVHVALHEGQYQFEYHRN